MIENLQEENCRLRRAVVELTILNEISAAINVASGLEEIIKLIVHKCVQHLGAEQGTIWLLDEAHGVATLKTLERVVDAGIPFRVGESLVGWVLKYRHPLVVNDLASDQRFSHLVREYTGLRSLLAVPLSIQNRTVGVLCLFNKRAGESFSADDARLLSIVATQSVQTIESARLYEDERRLLVLEEDLKVAHYVQRALLPKENPDLNNLDIAGLYASAQLIGGDYYDFIPIDEHHLGVALADVSGKGAGAALLMANLQSCLRGHPLLSQSISDTVASINMMFCKFLNLGRFITLIYGVLDIPKQTFAYVNAGHCFPLKVDRDGNIRELESNDLVLGVLPHTVYKEHTIRIQSGETVLLYTDGVTDASDAKEQMFGEENLIRVLRENRNLEATKLLQEILDSVRTFQGGVPQTDDVTLVVIRAR